MHVVIGSTELQQGLDFYQLRKLLRILKIFNDSDVSNCSYSTLHTFTYKHTIE
jgi:hypothetical protein